MSHTAKDGNIPAKNSEYKYLTLFSLYPNLAQVRTDTVLVFDEFLITY